MTDIGMLGTFRLADVFGKSIAIYSRNFVPFIILAIIASIPYYAVLLAIDYLDASSSAATVGLRLLDVATDVLAGSAIIYGVVQQLRSQTFSVGDSIKIAFRRLLPLLGITVYSWIVIGLGMVVLSFLGVIMLLPMLGVPVYLSIINPVAAMVVQGIVWACMFFVAEPVCVAEQAGVFTSASRSRSLTEGHRMQAFGMVLLTKVAAIALMRIAGVIDEEIGETAMLIGRGALSAVVVSFNGVLVSVFYYELRVAKEGVDIDRIARVFD